MRATGIPRSPRYPNRVPVAHFKATGWFSNGTNKSTDSSAHARFRASYNVEASGMGSKCRTIKYDSAMFSKCAACCATLQLAASQPRSLKHAARSSATCIPAASSRTVSHTHTTPSPPHFVSVHNSGVVGGRRPENSSSNSPRLSADLICTLYLAQVQLVLEDHTDICVRSIPSIPLGMVIIRQNTKGFFQAGI